MNISDAQRRVWDAKIAQGFNTTDVQLEFMLLNGEISEAFQAWRCRDPGLGEELADVAMFVLSLAEMTGVDLGGEIQRKIAKNATRRYERDGHGVLRRVLEGS